MGKHLNCVVCDTRGSESEENQKNDLEWENSSCLQQNLKVYFFLRHVIKLPTSQIENYLVWCSSGGKWHDSGTENMSTWIWLCEDCKCFVLKLEEIYRKIEQLKKESNKLEELIRFKMVSLKTLKSKSACNGENEEMEQDNSHCAIFNISRDVQEFVTRNQDILNPHSDGVDLDAIKTDGIDNSVVCPGKNYDETSPVRQEDDDEDNIEAPSTPKRSKIRKRKKKTLSHQPSRLRGPGTRSPGEFSCADCCQKFSTAIKLQTHRIREHRTDSFKCEICGNNYKFRQTLTNHMSFAHGHEYGRRREKEPNVCKICGKEFPWKVNLVQHLAGVHKMDSLACEICGASVPRHLLDKHLFKEHGIGNVKHWVCEVEGCGKIFYKKYDLKFHKRNTHEKGEVAPEFQCEECGKGFHVKTVLNRHMKLHRGKQEMPWGCDKCGKRFAREDYLKNHKISQHEGQMLKRKKKVKKEDLD